MLPPGPLEGEAPGVGGDELRLHGIAEAEARRLAIQFLVAIEGAFILCRAAKDIEAMHVAGDAVAASVAAALT